MLLAKLHRHEEALRLLLGEPPQLEMAYDYCDEVAASGRAEDADVYLTLLKVQGSGGGETEIAGEARGGGGGAGDRPLHRPVS